MKRSRRDSLLSFIGSLFFLSTTAQWAFLRKSFSEDGKWKKMTKDTLNELLSKKKNFQKLSYDAQTKIVKKFNAFKEKYSPTERFAIRVNLKRLDALPVSKKERLVENFERWKAMPESSKIEIAEKYKRWKVLPAEKRKAIIRKLNT